MTNFGRVCVHKIALNLYSSGLVKGVIGSHVRFHSQLSPLQLLNQRIDNNEILLDKHQEKVCQALEKVYEDLKGYEPASAQSAFSKFFSFRKKDYDQPSKAPKGLYIYGSVGGGKTMLMDLFFECCTVCYAPHLIIEFDWTLFLQMEKKKRVHFNSFMTDVHSRIHELKNKQVRDLNSTKPQPFDPIKPVADLITSSTHLICFDEFQVS